MKTSENEGIAAAIGVIAFGVVVSLGPVIALGWVVIHFLRKWW